MCSLNGMNIPQAKVRDGSHDFKESPEDDSTNKRLTSFNFSGYFSFRHFFGLYY